MRAHRPIALPLLLLTAPACSSPPPPAVTKPAAPASSSHATPASTRWRLAHHETFDTPFAEPKDWVEDRYGDASPYHVDAYDDDGAFFREKGGPRFAQGLAAFRSFRKSYRHGDAGWLTIELYGRDSDRDGIPETGGHFISERGKAKLVSARHYDGAILRSTDALPRRYRIEVTVSGVRFGGKTLGSFTHEGKVNGYDGDEVADPWFFDEKTLAPRPATTQNGVYFLCITDYPRPAPHNNIFIHHHRKVVIDTDSNDDHGHAWSSVWNPRTGRAEEDGDRYAGLLWLRGDDFGHPLFGNEFLSFTPHGFVTGTTFADKYLPDETYVYAVERSDEAYTLSISGRFVYGGQTTYRATRPFRGPPPTWHYNQTPEEYSPPGHDQRRTIDGKEYSTWPEGSAYPDYFFFGDPHINFYEGTAEYDDLKVYLPDE